MGARPPFLDRAGALSDHHGVAVCRSLGNGVLEALGRLFTALAASRLNVPHALFEQSLTVLYRILFLLFAEARGLVPMWHPVYRERYSIEAIVSELLAGRRYRGVWRAVLAISRLAHSGCSAGALKVTAFNGRLFAPAYSSAFDRTHIEDAVMSDAVMAVGTTQTPSVGRARISYADLDVEQLGAVYERVLEYEPAARGAPALNRTRDVRRSSGTFYTPRGVTAFLVRRTLEPLVQKRSADEILCLRVLDPAMGSGAFLVGACRYLAQAVEESLIREGRWHSGDISAADRASVRREIAQRCLFGVDINPMAVQLARLSLWLATLASDKPLTFLDHHLVPGDSLVGATVGDVMRQPPGTRGRQRRIEALSLFEDTDLAPTLRHAVRTRIELASAPDESAAIVAAKEKILATLNRPASPLGRWSAVLDLWCASWFWDDGPPGRQLFRELSDRLLGKAGDASRAGKRPAPRALGLARGTLSFPALAAHVSRGLLRRRRPQSSGSRFRRHRGQSALGHGSRRQRRTRRSCRPQARGAPARRLRTRRGYLSSGKPGARQPLPALRRARVAAHATGRPYRTRSAVRYPLGFRCCTAATAPLRSGRHRLNRGARQSQRHLPYSSQPAVRSPHGHGRPADERSCVPVWDSARGRPGGTGSCSPACRHSRPLLARVSGDDDLGIPEIGGERDLKLLEKISARFQWLGSEHGWNVRFGRELNATDDSGAFAPFTGADGARPVLEGKQIEPFRVSIDTSRYELRPGTT